MVVCNGLYSNVCRNYNVPATPEHDGEFPSLGICRRVKKKFFNFCPTKIFVSLAALPHSPPHRTFPHLNKKWQSWAHRRNSDRANLITREKTKTLSKLSKPDKPNQSQNSENCFNLTNLTNLKTLRIMSENY
jgi:hypothetical protein